MKLFGNSRKGGAHARNAARVSEEQEIRVTEVRSDDAQADAAAGQEEVASPAAAAPEKPKKSARRGLLIAGAVVLVLLAAAGIHFLVSGHFFWEDPLDPIRGTEGPSPTPGQALRPAQTDAQGEIIPTEAPVDGEDPFPDDEEDPDALHISADSPRKEGVFTFLLAGIDQASSSTDTIMVVSFDTKNHKISATSIPRDTLINISWATTPKKINAVLPGYSNSGKDGVAGLCDHIKNILGFEVDYYVMVSLEAVEHAVDAVGGVEFDVPFDMKYSAPDQDLYIDIKKGPQTLDGKNALHLCRYRATYAGGDLDRINMQHDFLMAMATQVIKKLNVTNVHSLVDVLVQDVDTDLTAGNLAWLGRQFLSCKAEDIVFQTAPNYPSGVNDVSYVGLLVDDWLKMVNDSINPYEDAVTTSNVNILTFNYGGSGLGSTTGNIAGGYGSFYCITCTVKNGGRAIYHSPGAHIAFPDPTQAPSSGGTSGGESGGAAASDAEILPAAAPAG